MKITLTIVILLLFAQTAFSQTIDFLKSDHDILLMSLLKSQSSKHSLGQKTTGTKERLIGASTQFFRTDTSSARLLDSSYIMYSGANGSQFNFSSMGYNVFNVPSGSNIPGLYLSPIAPNDLPDVYFDSAIYYVASGSSLFSSKFYRTYSGVNVAENNRVSDTIITYETYTYNSHGNIEKYISGHHYPHRLDTSTVQYFGYNALQQLILDSTSINTGGMIPYYKHSYSYDAHGNIAFVELWTYSIPAATPYNQTHYIATYDASNRIVSLVTDVDTGFARTRYSKDTFAYTPGVDYYTYTSDSVWGTTRWGFKSSTLKYVNAIGTIDSAFSSSEDIGVITNTRRLFEYDTQNNPTKIIAHTSGGNNYTTIMNYYYQPYTTAVQVLASAENNFRLYPNPVTDMINISGPAITGRLAVTIYNTIGQILRRFNAPANAEKLQLQISDLSPGTYYISVQNNNESKPQVLSFIKE